MQFTLLSALVAVSLTLGSVQAAVVNAATAAVPVATGAVVPPTPLAGAGITCNNWQIVPNTADVAASCADPSGARHDARISLGQCVANNNGALGCRSGGGAGASCVFFGIFQSGSSVFISSHCTTANGGSQETDNFNLNNCLSNTNGALTC
ncbi:hypothetical protein C8R45DRAFT_1076476 [Mycena sanguinolenta]|nr:hypothetical protein C8R45DRAFT_1076476 [Mycena sanguinolenta]